MCEFLASVVPVRTQASSSVVSMDIHTSTVNNKFSYSVEIAPICKDDLVVLPKSFAKSLGNISQLLLCSRISNAFRLMDPVTLQIADVPAEKYFREPFPSLCQMTELVEFIVLDIEPSGISSHDGRWMTADAQVSPLHATSFGDADAVFHTRTHLGALLQPGDTVLGYSLGKSNFNSLVWDTIPEERKPDVILVKKSYPDTKKRRSRRNWKLKSMAKVEGEEDNVKTAVGRKGGLDGQKVQRDYELFLKELEEDEEMRAGVNLYRDPEAEERNKKRREDKARWKARKLAMDTASAEQGLGDDEVMRDAAGKDGDGDLDGLTDDGFTTDGESEFGDDDVPGIRMEELLDDMDGESSILRVNPKKLYGNTNQIPDFAHWQK